MSGPRTIITQAALDELQETDPDRYVEFVSGGNFDIVSNDDIVEACDKHECIYSIAPTWLGEHPVAGATVTECDSCGDECWISPAMKSSWQSSGGAKVCMTCTSILRIQAITQSGEKPSVMELLQSIFLMKMATAKRAGRDLKKLMDEGEERNQ